MSCQWKLVPVEPTETMVIHGFESAPDECFSDEEVWEQYQEMSGCQQAAFRAKLCWAAMLAAAPAPDTHIAAPEESAGMDFGIDGRSVRVSQEAYSIFLAREAAGREKIAALQQRLTAADERWDELVSAVRSINRSPHYMVKAIDDDQPQYRQRKEWIDWVLELCDAAPTSSERSNKDYAIEHAEYMAQSADDVLAKFQAYGLALLAVDEGGDDGEDELLENIDSARGDLQESLVDLRSMVYEFRKRSAKT
ncbi:MAG: hypothetical protein RR726_02395 [Pseudomonas sp.]